MDSNESKFSAPGIPGPYPYPRTYLRQETSAGRERLTVGVAEHGSQLLRALISDWEAQFWLLYVLILSRCGAHEEGRYQSPNLIPRAEVDAFLVRFGEFLDADARHNLWIGAENGVDQIIYDRHNLLYIYGRLDPLEQVLRSAGFTSGSVLIPSPHQHFYRTDLDLVEDDVLDEMAWVRSDLRDGDD